MESRVKASDRRQLRQRRRDGIERGERLGLMKRSEVAQLAHPRLRIGVDPHRLAEALTSVNDAVPNSIRFAQHRVERGSELIRVHLRARSIELPRGDHSVIAVEQRQLQAAGARVDDQDPHRCAYVDRASFAPGQHQSVTSGGSCPCSRV